MEMRRIAHEVLTLDVLVCSDDISGTLVTSLTY